jgi:hypothetical protein
MTHRKFRLPFPKRGRRRPRPVGDPAAVFRTFVHVLARMQAQARESPAETAAEKMA